MAALPLFALVVAVFYVADRALPFGYYKDLGVNLVATANIDASVRSVTDLIDSIGWAPWDNAPAFAFNPMVTYAFLVPLAKLANHNYVVAIKLAQILQFLLAWGGAAWLYSDLRQRVNPWAFVAGFLYAIVPVTAGSIAGNLDFGFVFALMPGALTLSLKAIDRSGPRALPFAGVVCGAAGLDFAVEYFFVSSLAMYALCALRALRGRISFSWLAYAITGGAFSAIAGLFVILPSLDSRHVFRESAARIVEIDAGRIVHQFSETYAAFLALTPVEALLSPNPVFNSSASLPAAWFAAGLLWLCVIGSFFIPKAFRTFRLGSGLAIIAICSYLALGTNIVLGDVVWSAIAHLPVVQLLRTPDRFIAIPALFVPLLAVVACEEFSAWVGSLGHDALRFVPVLLLACSIGGFLAVDAQQNVLHADPTIDFRDPSVAKANAAVKKIGGRTIPIAFVNGGSAFDTPLYGAGSAFERYGWDLTERFSTDGQGGTGIFRRAAVRSAIVTPNWTYDVANIPDFRNVWRSSDRIDEVLKSGRVSVFAIDKPLAEVSAVRSACLFGDSGLLDRLDAAPVLDGIALVHENDGPCDVNVIADSDARTELGDAALGTWPAALFMAKSAAMRDADYPFMVSRNVLAPAWYRDTIDGSQPISGGPAVQTYPGFQGILPRAPRAARDAEVLVRIANHHVAAGHIEIGTRSVSFTIPAHLGLRWEAIHIGPLPAKAKVRVTIVRSGPDVLESAPWHGIAIDAVGLRDTASAPHVFDAAKPTYVGVNLLAATMPGNEEFWLPRGTFTVDAYAHGGKPAPASIFTVDGRAATTRMTFAKAAMHVAAASRSTQATLAIFVPASAPRTTVSPITVSPRSSASWTIDVPGTETLEAAVLDDGNWKLSSSERSITPDGVTCDLVNTCFPAVPRGRYTLSHRWPRSIVLGLSFALLALLVALALVVAPLPRSAATQAILRRRASSAI